MIALSYIDSQVLQLPAQLVGFNKKTDHTYSLRFNTRELLPGELQEIDTNFYLEGNLIFNLKSIQAGDLEFDEELDSKTPSQRMRAVLYLHCKQSLGKKPTDEEWRAFYYREMERIINLLKLKLDPDT